MGGHDFMSFIPRHTPTSCSFFSKPLDTPVTRLSASVLPTAERRQGLASKLQRARASHRDRPCFCTALRESFALLKRRSPFASCARARRH